MLPALLRSSVFGVAPRALTVRNGFDSDSDSDTSSEADGEQLLAAVLRLPPVVFRRLLLFVDSPLVLIAVCSAWAEGVLPALYSSPSLQGKWAFARLIRTLAKSANTTSVYEYHPLIEQLRIEGPAAENIEMGDLETALALCSNIEAFTLTHCLHISSKIIQSLSDYVPQLSVLSLEGCPIGDGYIPDLVKGCPNLTSLNLSATNVSFASFDILLTGLRSLESLSLDGIQPAEPEDPNPRPRRASFIGSPPPTTRNSGHIIKGPTALKLTSVSMSGSRPALDHLQTLATRAPNLATLCLSGCDTLTDAHMITLLNQLSTPPSTIQLSSLDLDGCELLTSTTALKIAETCAGVAEPGTPAPPTDDRPSTNMLELLDSVGRLKFMTRSLLKRVGLSGTRVTAGDVRRLVRECGGLVEVRVDGCEGVEGSFVKVVAGECWEVEEETRMRVERQKKAEDAGGKGGSGVDMARRGSRLPLPVKKMLSPPVSPPMQARKLGAAMPRDWCRLIGVEALKRVADFEGEL
ncbi:hypothetical protein HDU98_008999 [Podochytrium sp. JEL0797]|nr:hypothetical protein HDU98_008999 [Podochytrium sp. JEL0797]